MIGSFPITLSKPAPSRHRTSSALSETNRADPGPRIETTRAHFSSGRYYVEAWNAAGKRRAEDPSTPFVAQVFSPAAVKSLGKGPGGWWKLGLVVGLVALPGLRTLFRRRRDDEAAEQDPSFQRKSRLAYPGVDPEESGA